MKAAFKDFEIKVDYPDAVVTSAANEAKTKQDVADFLTVLGKDRFISLSHEGLTFTVFYWEANDGPVTVHMGVHNRIRCGIKTPTPLFIQPTPPPPGTPMCKTN